MNTLKIVGFSLLLATGLGSCGTTENGGGQDASEFVWVTEQFADLKIVRYQVPGWENLSDSQRALVYCLNQAGLSGRDMMYDQNNPTTFVSGGF